MPHRSGYPANTFNHDCVLWENPVPDGQGGYTYDTPTQPKCRWEDQNELFTDNEGQERRSLAVVFIDQDVETGAKLFRGVLTDLSAGERADPQLVDKAYEARRSEGWRSLKGKTPVEVRRVWL